MTKETIAFRVRQRGITMARVEGAVEEAEAEIMHYAIQYRRDGEVTIEHNAAGYWKRFALLCKWPLSEGNRDV